jgi:cell division protein FtsW
MNKIGIALLFTSFFLTCLGIFILFETSTYSSLLQIGDKYHFVKFQAGYAIVGILMCLIISRIPYLLYKKYIVPILVITVILLIAVLIPGIGLELKGARRWINFGLFVMQPSEALKITLSMYLAAWLSVKEKGRLLAFCLLVGVMCGLVMLQPDLGTTMIVAITSVILYFLSGAPLKHMAAIFLVGIVGVLILIKVEPYRAQRLMAFQNFNYENLSENDYHVKQVLIALGSGGMTGVGIGKSIQKYAYLPEATTDSIFAIYSEETGFVGGLFLIAVFILFSAIGFLIALSSPDPFAKLLGAGIISFISLQALMNFASQVVLMPLTGVPLPFISYGGSSLLINFVAVGILLNISRFIHKKT